MDREYFKRMAEETLRIIEHGGYHAPSGQWVSLAQDIQEAVENTIGYPPEHKIPPTKTERVQTQIVVANETTLQGLFELAKDGEDVAVLNFASAKKPGGGFKGGSQAQEESLARASALYATLQGQAMYTYHKRQRDLFYSSYAIYSPRVPVFRDDNGTLLEQPILASFITAPAVNRQAMVQREREKGIRLACEADIKKEMALRIQRILAIAAYHQHTHLVLGAWGCGVFGNDPEMIARLFDDALQTTFKRAFGQIRFSVLDTTSRQSCFLAFQACF